jgi:hypothetical protein
MIQPVVLGSLHGEGNGASLPVYWRCSTNKVGWLLFDRGTWKCSSSAPDIPCSVFAQALSLANVRYPKGIRED